MTERNKKVKKIIKSKFDNTDYKLRLYITGTSPNSIRAISNIKEICEKYIMGNYDLEVIDVYQEPEMAEIEQIIALPLLVKMAPLPVRKMVGDMSNTANMLRGLGIETN